MSMIFKYLFYFVACIGKKLDHFEVEDHYISAYILVGFCIAVNLFVIVDLICIFVVRNRVISDVMNNMMGISSFVIIALSYLYFRHNNRRDKIYDEIRQISSCKKIKYGIYCVLYVILSFGLWFICNDIMCVLRNGHGDTYAQNIVEKLNLTYW